MAQPLPGPVVRVLPYLCLGVCLHANERLLTLAIFKIFMSDPPFQWIFVVKSFTSPVFAMQMDCLWQSPNPILGSFASRFPQVVQELSAKVSAHSGQRDVAPMDHYL